MTAARWLVTFVFSSFSLFFLLSLLFFFFFFFNDTATTEIYTLSLHDALPISWHPTGRSAGWWRPARRWRSRPDRKSTRLNSSHMSISYAVFCLKKKKKKKNTHDTPKIRNNYNATSTQRNG